MKEHRRPKAILQRALLIVSTLLVSTVIVAGPAPSKEPAQGATAQSLPLLVDVGADRCIPCKMMAPILEDLKREYAGVLDVQFIDAWKKPEEAEKYRVRGIPTQIFYDTSGRELGRHLGFMGKEDILKEFERLGVTLKKPAHR